MARKTFTSAYGRKLEKRLAGLKAIDPVLTLHNGVTVAAGETLQSDLKKAEQEYNIMLNNLEVKRNAIKLLEKDIADYCTVTLLAVKSQFGADSIEYGQAGGIRSSLRQKPVRRKPTKAVKKVAQTA